MPGPPAWRLAAPPRRLALIFAASLAGLRDDSRSLSPHAARLRLAHVVEMKRLAARLWRRVRRVQSALMIPAMSSVTAWQLNVRLNGGGEPHARRAGRWFLRGPGGWRPPPAPCGPARRRAAGAVRDAPADAAARAASRDGNLRRMRATSRGSAPVRASRAMSVSAAANTARRAVSSSCIRSSKVSHADSSLRLLGDCCLACGAAAAFDSDSIRYRMAMTLLGSPVGDAFAAKQSQAIEQRRISLAQLQHNTLPLAKIHRAQHGCQVGERSRARPSLF